MVQDSLESREDKHTIHENSENTGLIRSPRTQEWIVAYHTVPRPYYGDNILVYEFIVPNAMLQQNILLLFVNSTDGLYYKTVPRKNYLKAIAFAFIHDIQLKHAILVTKSSIY